MHPQPRVQLRKHTSVVTARSTGAARHSRTRMVLTAYFELSPVIGRSCHRHRADISTQLDASVEASGPHDFAVRGQARFVLRAAASIASRPASVTIAIRPHVGRDGNGYRTDFTRRRSEIFFVSGLDSDTLELPVGQISIRLCFANPPRRLGISASLREAAATKQLLFPAVRWIASRSPSSGTRIRALRWLAMRLR